MKTQMIFVGVLSAIFLTGCDSLRVAATATESELCRQWGYALPTRSRSDSEQTQAEITVLYAAFSLSCPAWDYLIPE